MKAPEFTLGVLDKTEHEFTGVIAEHPNFDVFRYGHHDLAEIIRIRSLHLTAYKLI